MTFHGPNNAMFFRHNYPQGWVSDTGPQNIMEDDMIIPLLGAGHDEILWCETETLIKTEELNETDKNRFARQNEIDDSHQMSIGASVALDVDKTNGVSTGMGLRNSTMPEQEFLAHWHTHSNYIKALCGVLDTSIRKDHLPSYVGLTTTERDCLNFAASGRQFAEIEYLMRLSEDQVKKIFSRCRKKLQAKTRDHAVAKALVLGLINP